MTQPKALYLADVLEHKATHEHGTMLEMSCAAELRRLSAERDALLEALKYHQEQTRPIQRTIDAIKAAEGEKE